MKRRIVALAAILAASASVAFAMPATSDPGGTRKNLQIFNDVSTAVNHYAFFTIFDDVSASVHDGMVTLTGKVTMPYKRDELAKRVAKVEGVEHVQNRLEVLPVSRFDDQLRTKIARAIYRNGNFVNLSRANPPIHIVVEHGHVTLTGVVQSEVDRALARSLATQFGAMGPVSNQLKTSAEAKEELEHIS